MCEGSDTVAVAVEALLGASYKHCQDAFGDMRGALALPGQYPIQRCLPGALTDLVAARLQKQSLCSHPQMPARSVK